MLKSELKKMLFNQTILSIQPEYKGSIQTTLWHGDRNDLNVQLLLINQWDMF